MDPAAPVVVAQSDALPGLSLAPDFSAGHLLDTLPWGVLVLDEQHLIRGVNQQAAHWCGTVPETLLGRPLPEAGLPPAISAALQQLLEPGVAQPQEVYLPPHAQWLTLSATRQPGGWVLYAQDITPQKQREQQYQTLADNTPDVLTRWTPDLRLDYANAAFATKTGQPLSALLGRTFGEMGVTADITGPYMAALQRVFDTGQPQEHYNPFEGPHGTVYFYSRLVPELREGQVATVLGIARDITELQQSQAEALRLQRELTQQAADHYHALFQTMGQGFCVLEILFDEAGQQAVDFRYLELNSVFAQQLGMPAGTQGYTARALLPDLEPFWFDIYGRVARTGESIRVEHYVPQVGRWFDVHAFQLGEPAVQQIAVLFSDITARKHAVEALAASEAQYRTLFESMDEGFCTIEVLFDSVGNAQDYVFLETNPAFERQTGLVNAVGRSMRELAPAHEDFWFDTYGHVARTGEAVRLEHEAAALGNFYDVHAFRLGDPAQHHVAILFNNVLDRKRAEEALRQSEEQLRLFVTASSDSLYRMDAGWQHMLQMDGRHVLADTASPSATWLEAYIPPADQPTVTAAIAAAIVGPRFFALEHRIMQADGSVGWTSSHAVPVLDVNGKLVEWFGTATDITARKQAEEALLRSEERLRRMMNVPHVGVLTFRLDGTLLAANDAFLDLMGYTSAELAARSFTWQDFTPPEYAAESQRQLERIQQTGLGGPYEKEYLRRDGSRQWLLFVAAVLGDGTLVEYAVDIAARKQVEEAMRVSEAKYRTLFETMDQGFGVGEVLPAGPGRAADFRWLEVNPRVEQLTSMPQAALLSGETMRTVMPQLEDSWYERYERVALTGESIRFEEQAQVLGRWFDVYAYPLDGPAPHRVALLFTNITARKQAEVSLRLAEERHRAELEQQVTARTRELQQSRSLLQTVFDASPTAIVVMRILRDAVGRPEDFEILIYNEFNKQVVGRADLAGQRLSALFPQTVPTGILARLLAVATTGEPADFENWYEGEGMQHWFRHIFVRQDGLLVMTSEVITARKQAEQERTRNLRLLEQAEAVAGLGSWDYDLLSQAFLWSDGMYHLFGLPLGQAIDPGIYLDYVVAEDLPQAERLVHCLTTGSVSFEETLRLRVGEQVKTVRIKAVVLHDEAGVPVRTLGVDLDISQLQRLEADNLRLRLTQQQALFEAVQAAQEAERKRMAESLHNGIGQLLYATKLRLDQLHAPVLHTLPALVAARNEADKLLSTAIQQTRALSHELVPVVLEEFGLAAALRDIASKMNTPQLRLRSHVLLDEAAAPLAPALQMALYRMAQELAQNIAKHATGATEASLELETMQGWVLLRAEDNGPGFAPANRPGLGLRSIRDRVALLRGQVETGTAPFSGAYVRIRIPLPNFPTP